MALSSWGQDPDTCGGSGGKLSNRIQEVAEALETIENQVAIIRSALEIPTPPAHAPRAVTKKKTAARRKRARRSRR